MTYHPILGERTVVKAGVLECAGCGAPLDWTDKRPARHRADGSAEALSRIYCEVCTALDYVALLARRAGLLGRVGRQFLLALSMALQERLPPDVSQVNVRSCGRGVLEAVEVEAKVPSKGFEWSAVVRVPFALGVDIAALADILADRLCWIINEEGE